MTSCTGESGTRCIQKKTSGFSPFIESVHICIGRWLSSTFHQEGYYTLIAWRIESAGRKTLRSATSFSYVTELLTRSFVVCLFICKTSAAMFWQIGSRWLGSIADVGGFHRLIVIVCSKLRIEPLIHSALIPPCGTTHMIAAHVYS